MMMMRIRLRIGQAGGIGGATRLYALEDVRCCSVISRITNRPACDSSRETTKDRLVHAHLLPIKTLAIPSSTALSTTTTKETTLACLRSQVNTLSPIRNLYQGSAPPKRSSIR